MIDLPHVASRVFGTPLMIARSAPGSAEADSLGPTVPAGLGAGVPGAPETAALADGLGLGPTVGFGVGTSTTRTLPAVSASDPTTAS